MSSAVRVGAMAIALALAGCATTNPKDPLEKFNRAMFSFNDAIDQAALKPAAEAYRTLPSFVQTGVSNFFGNLGDVWTAANNLMQGKMADGMSDVMRVTFNSTFGLFGVLDIASEAGLAKHKEDFGQTLGKWGVGSGPYVVLPLLGPSTLRDTVATPVDLAGDPWDYARPVRVRNLGYVGRVVDQ
ncbi:MAG: phospholipid-binding lipoprotein MlaA, partial [Burkholderiales bacterium]